MSKWLDSSNGLSYYTQPMYEGISEIDNPEELFISGLGECTDEHVKIDNYFVFTTPSVLSLAGETVKELSVGDKVVLSPTSLMYCPHLKEIHIVSDSAYASKAIGNCVVSVKRVEVTCPHSELPAFGEATEIGYRALAGLWEREEIVIPDGYVRIGAQACYKCERLKTVTIPQSVKQFGKNVFADCVGLERVVFGGSKTEWEALLLNSEEIGLKAGVAVVCRDGEHG